jgi:hypothetical protein
VKTVQPQTDLTQIVLATYSAPSFTSRLNRRQQQRQQDTDNSHAYQQFHKRESKLWFARILSY